MPSTRSEWDEKHRLTAKDAAEAPAEILGELWPLLQSRVSVREGSGAKQPQQGGMALDLACGTGRNALFLAEHGHPVTAIDWSGAALEILEARAGGKGIPVWRIQKMEEVKRSSRPGIHLLQADLEKMRLPANWYQLIVSIRYLQRSLFPEICSALRPGGMLLFETYTQAQLELSGGPRDPRYLLNVGELRSAFPELRVVFYRELRAGQGIASLVARKPGGGAKERSQNGS